MKNDPTLRPEEPVTEFEIEIAEAPETREPIGPASAPSEKGPSEEAEPRERRSGSVRDRLSSLFAHRAPSGDDWSSEEADPAEAGEDDTVGSLLAGLRHGRETPDPAGEKPDEPSEEPLGPDLLEEEETGEAPSDGEPVIPPLRERIAAFFGLIRGRDEPEESEDEAEERDEPEESEDEAEEQDEPAESGDEAEERDEPEQSGDEAEERNVPENVGSVDKADEAFVETLTRYAETGELSLGEEADDPGIYSVSETGPELEPEPEPEPEPEAEPESEPIPAAPSENADEAVRDGEGAASAAPPRGERRPARPLPAFRTADRAGSLYLDVLLALLPLLVWAVYLYGWRPLVIAGLSTLFALTADNAVRLIRRSATPFDLSPAVSGLLLALCLPPTAPLWLPILGAAIAVLIRQLFGGVGRNRINPAVTALAVLYAIFPGLMSAYCAIGTRLSPFSMTVSDYPAAGASPLETLLSGAFPDVSLGEMLVGLRPGAIGESMALLLIGGAIFLSVRRVIRLRLPLVYLFTTAVLTYLFPTLSAASDLVAVRYAAYHLLGGNLLLGAFFLATDPVTTPRTPTASLIAGAAAGAVTVLVRYRVSPAIGVIVAVLVVNLLSRPLDLLLLPAPFGGRKKKPADAPSDPGRIH